MEGYTLTITNGSGDEENYRSNKSWAERCESEQQSADKYGQHIESGICGDIADDLFNLADVTDIKQCDMNEFITGTNGRAMWNDGENSKVQLMCEIMEI